ncbi:MAG: hypothetical protein EHM61_00460 [Acidobacteria bacterium]|nr:MAG: hypothetical protein EHM61_00460 [Acidobacteriota bacterium]
MNGLKLLSGTVLAGCLVVCAAAQGGDNLFRFSFTTEGQYRDVNADRPAKFFRFRDEPKGILLSDVTSQYNNPSRNFRLFLDADDLLQQDQNIYAWTNAGPYSARVQWDEIPFFQYSAARTPFQLNSDSFLPVVNPTQVLFEGLETNSPATAFLVESMLPELNVVDIRSRRDSLNIDQAVSASKNVGVHFNFAHHRQNGRRTVGTGTYVRLAGPGGDVFQVSGVELPAYIDRATYLGDLGLEYKKRKFYFSASYDTSVFHNAFDAIRWENPFRITNAQATPPSGGTERGRSAVSQVATEPDNQRHGLTWIAKYKWSDAAVLTYTSTFARWTQDESFLPYTLNTAITQTSIDAPITSVESLPRLSLNGEVQNWKHEVRVALEPFERLDVDLKYRMYRYDNQSPDIHFPGFAGYADSFWRTSIDTTDPNIKEPIESFPQDYTRQNAILETQFDIAEEFGIELDYEFEGWNRTLRNVSRSNEHRGTIALDARRAHWLKCRTEYQYANRTNTGYDPGLLEFAGLRTFDQNERIRNRAQTNMSFMPTERTSIGLSGFYFDDNYAGDPYGLALEIGAEVGVELQYMFTETFSINGNYAHEHRRSRLNSIAKTASPAFKVADTWVRNLNNDYDTVGAGFRVELPERKVALSFFYGLGLTENETHANNPYTPTTTNALAFDFPDVEERFHDAELEVEFFPGENLKWGFRASFEPYTLEDCDWDLLRPYMVGRIPQQAERFLFLDAKYNTYTAGLASIYLTYIF